LFQSYENALDNLDEEGKAELYSSILALLSKESVNNLDLLEEESAEQEEEDASLKEAGETEVAEILPKPLREHDAANVPHDKQLIPETPAPAVINKSAAEESLRSVAACVGPVAACVGRAVESAPYNVRPRVKPTEPEEEADIETKKLLEDAAAESFAKR
jgi:hypothetical protein